MRPLRPQPAATRYERNTRHLVRSRALLRSMLRGTAVPASLLLAAALAPSPAMAQSAPAGGADAPSSLPPVTVDAPRERKRAPVKIVRRPTPVVVAASRRRPVPVKVAARPVKPVVRQAPVTPPPAGTPPNSNSTLGPPPPAFAGGQVATGGQLGLLGNRGVLNTPFNQTSYTAKLIQDQQARTIGDVVNNDPSVRNVSSPGTGTQVFFIRGFFFDSGDISLNGVYGLAPAYQTDADFAARVEILKGPSALLNGIPPAGAIGGSINIVTKQAPDVDIAQITPYFVSRSSFGVLVDVSHRAGEQKEWGIRFNGDYRNGGTPFQRQTDEFGNAVLNIDYHGEHVRGSLDVGYQAENLNPPIRFLTAALPTLTGLPPAPPAGTNFEVPWATWKPQDKFALARAEVDVSEWATVYGAFGFHDSTISALYPSPILLDPIGNYASTPFGINTRIRTSSGEAGFRAALDTGPVHHRLSFNYSAYDQPTNQVFTAGTLIMSNIYNPPFVPAQTPTTLVGSTRLSTTASSVGVADTASILDERVQLTAGVRRQTVGQGTLDNLDPTNDASTTTSVYSPAFALLIKPIENLAFYANYIQGLQAGQTVGAGFSNAGQQFPAFVSTQIETGAKYDAGRFATTLDVFQITQPQISTGSAGGTTVTQTVDGQQRNKGVELNVFGELTPQIRLLGGVTYIDGRLTKTANGLNDGRRAVGVANWNVNLGAELDTPWLVRGLTFTGRAIYTSEEAVNATNTLMLPDWVRFDVGARYTFTSPFNGKPIIVRAAVENVANLGYYGGAYNGVITVGAPRTYLVSSTFNF